jgi:hypothetical protein
MDEMASLIAESFRSKIEMAEIETQKMEEGDKTAQNAAKIVQSIYRGRNVRRRSVVLRDQAQLMQQEQLVRSRADGDFGPVYSWLKGLHIKSEDAVRYAGALEQEGYDTLDAVAELKDFSAKEWKAMFSIKNGHVQRMMKAVQSISVGSSTIEHPKPDIFVNKHTRANDQDLEPAPREVLDVEGRRGSVHALKTVEKIFRPDRTKPTKNLDKTSDNNNKIVGASPYGGQTFGLGTIVDIGSSVEAHYASTGRFKSGMKEGV